MAQKPFSLPFLLLPAWMGALSGCALGPHAVSHPVADEWTPVVPQPAFALGEGPIVLVDAAHGNWHTIDGRFKPFAQLLRSDGYQVRSSNEKISSEWLHEADVFVMANAVKGGEESVWVLPTPPALAPEETQALVDWVADGGCLLLIADHMPFPGAVSELAAAFGVVFLNGFAIESVDGGGTLMFTRAAGSLADHPISRGRTAAERVPSVKSFTGQAFRTLTPSQPLMFMPEDWEVFFPKKAWKIRNDTPRESAHGLVQGAVLEYGKGRLAVFGEAAMFTAQAQADDGHVVRVGMNDPEAAYNAQFVLNVMHWLSGVLPDDPAGGGVFATCSASRASGAVEPLARGGESP